MSKSMALAAAESVRSLKNTTTGARIENKWTLTTVSVDTLINNLEKQLQNFNILVEARDRVQPGTKNVTHTVYLDQFKLNIKDSGLEVGPNFKLAEVTFKPRIRKYGVVDLDKAISTENIRFADFTKDHSFVEFKFSDARFNGAVFKPRMYMADKYIELFGTEEFLKMYDQIVVETLALKPNLNSADSVRAMLHFLKLGHVKKVSFKKVAVNVYERISLAINFIDKKLKNSVFQIQMTLDQSISLFVYELGRKIQAYDPAHTVVEVKTPVEYADYKLQSDLSGIQGYQQFLEFLEHVKKNHLPQYLEGVGKNGHGHRGYLQETTDLSQNKKNLP